MLKLNVKVLIKSPQKCPWRICHHAAVDRDRRPWVAARHGSKNAHHFAEFVEESSERVMLTLFSDILRSGTMTVLDVARKTSVWKVD